MLYEYIIAQDTPKLAVNMQGKRLNRVRQVLYKLRASEEYFYIRISLQFQLKLNSNSR